MSFQLAGIIVLLETSAVVQESSSQCTVIPLEIVQGLFCFNPNLSLWTWGKSFQKPDGKQTLCDTVRISWLFLFTAGTWSCSDAGITVCKAPRVVFFPQHVFLNSQFHAVIVNLLSACWRHLLSSVCTKNIHYFIRGPSFMQLLWVFFTT